MNQRDIRKMAARGRNARRTALAAAVSCGSVMLGLAATAQASLVFTVPSTANPWLAGMPNGSVAGNGFDTAPAESPVQVTGITVFPGEIFTFFATGLVNNGSGGGTGGTSGPDGLESTILSRTPGAENGIADITSPINALLGVFLNATQPSLSSPPSALDFSTIAEQNFSTITPAIQQPFYIGDGLGSTNNYQTFVVPAGATRLYLGTMDGYQWNNNIGSYNVTIDPVPEPASIGLFLACASGLLFRRQWRNVPETSEFHDPYNATR